MSRKGENIYRRKDGRWEGRYIKDRVNEKTQFGYVYGHTYREVRAKLSAARQIWKEQAIYRELSRGTFRHISHLWFDEASLTRKESTLALYSDYLQRYILPKFGELGLEDITDTMISDFCTELLQNGGNKQQGLSTKTVSELLRVIKSIRKFAVRRGFMVGFTGDLTAIRQIYKPLRVLSSHEQEVLCRSLRNGMTPDKLGILICLHTGLRIGEICAMKWDDISLSKGELQVRRTLQRIPDYSGNTKKTKIIVTEPKSICSYRTIPLPENLTLLMKRYYRKGSFILTGDPNRFIEPRTLQNRLKAILASCNIKDAHFHTLRHTFATRCVEVGFDPKSLSEILGHSNIATTQLYTHVDRTHVRMAYLAAHPRAKA